MARSPVLQKAERLRAALTSRLQPGSPHSPTNAALLAAIKACDAFLVLKPAASATRSLTTGQGTDAEFQALLQKVALLLADQGTKKERPARAAQPAAEVATLGSASAPRSQSQASASSSVADIPSLLLETRAHLRMSDFDRIALLQDERSKAEDSARKASKRRQQAATRARLDGQMAEIDAKKQAQRQAAEQAQADMDAAVKAAYMQEERERVAAKEAAEQQHRVFSEQVEEAHARVRAEKARLAREAAAERAATAAEARAEAEEKAARAEADRRALAQATADNEERRRQRQVALQHQQEEERRFNAEYAGMLEKWEANRNAATAAFKAKAQAAYLRAGGEALTRGLAEQAAADDARAQRIQAEAEAKAAREAAHKRARKQALTRDMLRGLEAQKAEHVRRLEQERDEKAARAAELARQQREDSEKRAAEKAALKERQKATLQEQVAAMRAEARRRFVEANPDAPPSEAWLHRPVLTGAQPAFNNLNGTLVSA